MVSKLFSVLSAIITPTLHASKVGELVGFPNILISSAMNALVQICSHHTCRQPGVYFIHWTVVLTLTCLNTWLCTGMRNILVALVYESSLLQVVSCEYTSLTIEHMKCLTGAVYSVGKGALVQVGEFWYPVHLLQLQSKVPRQWRVKHWRLSHFPKDAPVPSDIVLESNLRDELWCEQAERRKIRVRSCS